MTLREYLDSEGLTVTAFSKSIGITKQSISNISLGKSGPSLELALMIVKATGGAVEINTLIQGRRHTEDEELIAVPTGWEFPKPPEQEDINDLF